MTMVKNIEEVQQIGKDNMDAAMKSVGLWSKSMQAIAVETADYCKKAFEQSTAAAEKLIGAKSLDKAFEVQSDCRALFLRLRSCRVRQGAGVRRFLHKSCQADGSRRFRRFRAVCRELSAMSRDRSAGRVGLALPLFPH